MLLCKSIFYSLLSPFVSMMCTELRAPALFGNNCGYIESLSVQERTLSGDLVEHYDSPRTSKISEFRVSRLDGHISAGLAIFLTFATAFLAEPVVTV